MSDMELAYRWSIHFSERSTARKRALPFDKQVSFVKSSCILLQIQLFPQIIESPVSSMKVLGYYPAFSFALHCHYPVTSRCFCSIASEIYALYCYDIFTTVLARPSVVNIVRSTEKSTLISCVCSDQVLPSAWT